MKSSIRADDGGSTTLQSLIAMFALFSSMVMGAVFGAALMYLAIANKWLPQLPL